MPPSATQHLRRRIRHTWYGGTANRDALPWQRNRKMHSNVKLIYSSTLLLHALYGLCTISSSQTLATKQESTNVPSAPVAAWSQGSSESHRKQTEGEWIAW